MQLSGEHTHCGPPLEPDSGFTYSPQIFMDNKSESNTLSKVNVNKEESEVDSNKVF